MKEIRTVLGNISDAEVGVVLPHEHIFCYSDYLYEMAGKKYLDKEKVWICAVKHLAMMKEKYNLRTFVDCTPINIGRDLAILKKISAQTGINIISSTGFYYTEELLLNKPDEEIISEYIVSDAMNTNAGIIKCAVDDMSLYAGKMLRATAKAQRKLNLPMVVHTNAKKENGIQVLETILSEGVNPCAVTVSHLSDTDNVAYVKSIAKYGCYIGLDRHYGRKTPEYINEKVRVINELCEAGYADKILLSHDALFYCGFSSEISTINETPRFSYIFDNILPELSKELVEKLVSENPLNMLKSQ